VFIPLVWRKNAMATNTKLPVPATSNTVSEAKHWAKIPRAVVIHRMETSDCLDARLFWAIILWSWCGPQAIDYVVLKSEDGWIRKDAKGPIPAKLKDLRELLGLSRNMTGAVSRSIARLEAIGAIRFGEAISGASRAKLMYPVQEPTPPDAGSKLPVPATWYVGKHTITEADLPTDEVARTRAIQWLDELGTQWREQLKALRTGIHELLVQGASEHGIIIDKKSKNIYKSAPPTNSQPTPMEVEIVPEPEPAGWPEGGGDSENKISTEVEDHLRSFPIPEPLEPETIREVAKHIDTPELLEQFKEATAPDRVKPRKWILLVQIAERTARDGPRYAKAKAASLESSPPLSRMEQRLENYRRHCQEWEKLDHG
jgi:hypothetical protein